MTDAAKKRLDLVPLCASIAAVLAIYVFFGSVGRMSFRRIQWYQQHTDSPGAEYYVRLADGFLHGHLSMTASADPRLETMPDPYDYDARTGQGIDSLWDASYYKGAYYLYFTPLPALLFYIPHKLLTGGYPNDQLAGTFFAAWAFVAAALFLHRALRERRRYLPIWLWVPFVGLANLVPFSLPDLRVYELAVLCGAAMSATWALALLRFVEAPTRARAVMMTFWAAMAFASRQDLIVLLLPTAAALYFVDQPLRVRVRNAVAAAVPLALIFVALAAYNYARYGQIREYGLEYQMTFVSMKGQRMCSLCTTSEAWRFVNNAVHYEFFTPAIWTSFPYVEPLAAHVDRRVSFPGDPEQIVGIAAIAPLTIAGAIAALLLTLMRRQRDAATSATIAVSAGSWLVLFALSTCWWIVARYSLDFMLLMLIASAVAIERCLAHLDGTIRLFPLRAGVAILAVYSILVGSLMGFEGRNAAFRRFNPELYKKIGERLKVQVR